MSLNCIYGGECGGCMACQDDRFYDEDDDGEDEQDG